MIASKISESLQRDLQQGRARGVLIALNDSDARDTGFEDRAVRPGEAHEMLKTKAERYRAMQERVLARAAATSMQLRFQYVNLPLLHMQVDDLQSLRDMAHSPEVRAVYEDVQLDAELAESLPLINQPAVEMAGFLGAGTAVAVLDTGCDYTRSAFGSCTNAGAAGCKVAYSADFGASDSLLDPNGHGTNVSAIVLGVAPATNIIALDVFEGATARASTVLQAIDWVISNRDNYNIVAMNLSVGYGKFSSQCDDEVLATGITNAFNANILTTVATGNDGQTAAIASPACASNAISVGAVYDADVGRVGYTTCVDDTTAADMVTCFSNSASFVSLLAPGAPITAGGMTMSGTSQAASHVAGAIAVARAAFPGEPVSSTVSRLTSTGPVIMDPRNGVALPRLDLNAAIGGVGVVDTTAPVGTLMINAGATATNTSLITLAISATDDGPTISMCISNTDSCTSWTDLASPQTWALTPGDGSKTVTVALRDGNGNKTSLQASIVLDTKAPSGSTLSATPGDAQVQLDWTPATDADSGVASYRVQMAMTAAPSCATGTTIYTGSNTSFTHSGLTNGSVYGYHVCPIDAAGNVGVGSAVTARPAPELDGPTGTILIDQDAPYVNKPSVLLSLDAVDASGVSAMCISNTPTCTHYEPFATTKIWTLVPTNGVATVHAWFRDIYGNVSTAAAVDNIVLDMQAPTGNGINAVAGDGMATLTWTPSQDASSGLAGYKVVGAINTAPSCTTGDVVYDGTNLTTTVNGLANGSIYGYRVCPYDVAGNLGSGGSTTVRPAAVLVGPTGTITINQDAQFTNSRWVTLTLDAMAASGVADVCISNNDVCTAFVPYAATKTWLLATSDGLATVRVWFSDNNGNVSTTPVNDTIIVDITPPTSSIITAMASSGSVALQWTAATDAASGIAGYTIRYAMNAAPSCTSGTPIYSGTDLTFTHTGLTNGNLYAYRVCPFDAAGNVGTGSFITAAPR